MNKLNYYSFFLIRKFVFFIYLIKATKLKGFICKNESDVIIWAPIFSWKYLIRDRILMDFAHINSLSKQNVNFNLFFGKNIGKYYNKIIFLTFDFEKKYFCLNDYFQQFNFIFSEI